MSVPDGVLLTVYCAAVQAYLGRQFGLMPEGPEDAAHVESLLNICTDAVAVGRLACPTQAGRNMPQS